MQTYLEGRDAAAALNVDVERLTAQYGPEVVELFGGGLEATITKVLKLCSKVFKMAGLKASKKFAKKAIKNLGKFAPGLVKATMIFEVTYCFRDWR